MGWMLSHMTAPVGAASQDKGLVHTGTRQAGVAQYKSGSHWPHRPRDRISMRRVSWSGCTKSRAKCVSAGHWVGKGGSLVDTWRL